MLTSTLVRIVYLEGFMANSNPFLVLHITMMEFNMSVVVVSFPQVMKITENKGRGSSCRL